MLPIQTYGARYFAGIDAAIRELHSKVTADRDPVGRLPSLLHPLIRGLRGVEGVGLAATERGSGGGQGQGLPTHGRG